jgi:hypothetical protein
MIKTGCVRPWWCRNHLEPRAVGHPRLLNEPTPPRGVGDLLQLAAQSAAQLGIRSTVDGLEAVASRGGSSQFLTEARRLQRVLTAGQLT